MSAMTTLVCKKSNLENDNSSCSEQVSRHHFNHMVSLLLPECRTITSRLASAVNSFHNYYVVKSVPVYELLDKTFLDLVLNGATYALSYKTQIDQDNTFALFPNGHLILSVDKDTYEQLGLEGKSSHFIHGRPMRYVVTINLNDKAMSPGEKSYLRVLTTLKRKVMLKSDFLLAQHNTESLKEGALQSFLSRYRWTEHRPKVNIRFLKDMPCPALYSSDLRGSKLSCDPQLFLEWLGAVNTGVRCDITASRFQSTYVCPEPNIAGCQVLQCTIIGFLMPHDIYALVQELSHFDNPKLASWLSMTVHGFMDSPIFWQSTEHGFLTGGENFYSLVLFNNKDYWLHMATSSHDGCAS